MIFLKFIFFIFAAGFIAALFVAWSFFKQVRNASRRFREQQQHDGTTTKVNGNTIYDRRSPEASQKKIIPDDEGEYVDYVEN